MNAYTLPLGVLAALALAAGISAVVAWRAAFNVGAAFDRWQAAKRERAETHLTAIELVLCEAADTTGALR